LGDRNDDDDDDDDDDDWATENDDAANWATEEEAWKKVCAESDDCCGHIQCNSNLAVTSAQEHAFFLSFHFSCFARPDVSPSSRPDVSPTITSHEQHSAVCAALQHDRCLTNQSCVARST